MRYRDVLIIFFVVGNSLPNWALVLATTGHSLHLTFTDRELGRQPRISHFTLSYVLILPIKVGKWTPIAVQKQVRALAPAAALPSQSLHTIITPAITLHLFQPCQRYQRKPIYCLENPPHHTSPAFMLKHTLALDSAFT